MTINPFIKYVLIKVNKRKIFWRFDPKFKDLNVIFKKSTILKEPTN